MNDSTTPTEIPSRTVLAMMSETTTMEQIDYAVDALKSSVERIRSLSPLYDDFIKKQKEA